RFPKNSAGKKQMISVKRTMSQSTNCRCMLEDFWLWVASIRCLQPYIDTRRFPRVWLVENIHFAVPIQISDASLMKTYPSRENRLPKVPPPISVKNPSGGPRIIDGFTDLTPLGHFGGKYIEVAITVDVGQL